MNSLNARKDLFIQQPSHSGKIGWTVSSSIPRVLLSTTGWNEISRELSFIGPTNKSFEYSGSIESLIYFRHTSESQVSTFYRNRIGTELEEIRSINGKVVFLHRQPYYIMRTGIVIYTHYLHSFEEKPPICINMAGVSLEECQRIFHKGNLILIRKATASSINRMSKNLIVIGDSQLNEHCSVYTAEHLDFIYITNRNGLFFVFNTSELTITKLQLGSSYEIRHVFNDTALFSSNGGGMYCLRLNAKDWKTRCSLASDFEQFDNKMKNVKFSSEMTIDQMKGEMAREKAKNEAERRENNHLQIQMNNMTVSFKEALQIEMATSNSLRNLNKECSAIIEEREKRIQQLLMELAEVKEKARREKEITAAKDREQFKEIVKLRMQKAQAESAEVERQGEERKRIEKESQWKGRDQFEKKYRRMMLMFARPGLDDKIMEELEKIPYVFEDEMEAAIISEEIKRQSEDINFVKKNVSDKEAEENGKVELKRGPRNRRNNRTKQSKKLESLVEMNLDKPMGNWSSQGNSATNDNGKKIKGNENIGGTKEDKMKRMDRREGGLKNERREYYGKSYSDGKH